MRQRKRLLDSNNNYNRYENKNRRGIDRNVSHARRGESVSVKSVSQKAAGGREAAHHVSWHRSNRANASLRPYHSASQAAAVPRHGSQGDPAHWRFYGHDWRSIR